MKQYIDKAAVVAEINKRIIDASINNIGQQRVWAYNDAKDIIDTLEVKEVVAEQEGVCNNIFNRIIGDNWNLSIPLDKAGLKHGDKVKIFITKEK